MKKKILITGSSGFIGKNLLMHLKQFPTNYEIITLKHVSSIRSINEKIQSADLIIHLAGVNRPKNIQEFKKGNSDFTKLICDVLIQSKKNIPILFTSTAHINSLTIKSGTLLRSYVESKKQSEIYIINYAKKTNAKVIIYRIPHLIGKWAKPNYNSVVTTFCYNIARNKKINISNPQTVLEVIYIDDLIKKFTSVIPKNFKNQVNYIKLKSIPITVLDLAAKIYKINSSIENLLSINLNTKLEKILYSTFISYLPKNKIIQTLKTNNDSRGFFVECFKSKTFGQISYLSSKSNITRGNHYHNYKTEIFIVIAGSALYKSINPVTKSTFKVNLNGSKPQIIRTIPGEVHTIKNISKKELIVLVWANEVFDIKNQDTFFLND